MNKEEVQNMINDAIDKHNKTASIISAFIGTFLLIFYAHGVIAIVNNISK
jgi:glycerol uptake facilitator-like aquaporin